MCGNCKDTKMKANWSITNVSYSVSAILALPIWSLYEEYILQKFIYTSKQMLS